LREGVCVSNQDDPAKWPDSGWRFDARCTHDGQQHAELTHGVGAPSLGGTARDGNHFFGANDPRRNTGLALGY
jgi:hypothetical protein